MTDLRIVLIQAFFVSSYRVNVTSFVPGQRSKVTELKIEQYPSLVKLVEGF